MSNLDRGQDPKRKNVWNTYYPWALALYSILSIVILFIVVVSWLPSPEIPGVPPSQNTPVLPGLLGILFIVLAGRQFYLRGQTQSN